MLLSEFFTTNTVVELVCFSTAVLCLSRDKEPVWRYQRVYLLIVCLTELFARYLKKGLHLPNQWPYNIMLLFEAPFISLMFAHLLDRYNKKSRFWLSVGLLVLAAVYAIDLFTSEYGFARMSDITDNLMSALFSAYAFYYFYLLLKDDAYVDLRFSAEFWWVIGVLVFYFGTTGVDLYRDSSAELGKRHLSSYIKDAFIVICYSCWSYSFICRKRLNRST